VVDFFINYKNCLSAGMTAILLPQFSTNPFLPQMRPFEACEASIPMKYASSRSSILDGSVPTSRRAATVFLNQLLRPGALILLACLCLSAHAQQNEWTWMGGTEKPADGYGWPGQYGTLGTPAASNIPGSRQFGAGWTDKSGNLWLFGGWGYDSVGDTGGLNDLWQFNPTSNQWTWKGGSDSVFRSAGVYGTSGTPSAKNIPGGRIAAAASADSNGNVWLFGGYGVDSASAMGYLNDLWKFNPSTNEWTWVAGSSVVPGNCSDFSSHDGFKNGCGQSGVYGSLGTPATTNIPGGRYNAVSWVDGKGDLWVFGGVGADASGNIGILNDLWEFQPSKGEWTWVGGSSTIIVAAYGQAGVYGTLQTPSVENAPGGRINAVGWTDSKGDLWLFGGYGADSAGAMGYLNDLWKFNPSTNEWTWMGGSSAIGGLGGQPGVYESWLTPAAGNLPGGRQCATAWMDSSGNFWLFGGYGYDSAGNYGYLNDLWKFNPSTNEWSWMDGGNSIIGGSTYGNPGVYGTLQTPGFLNTPGGREGATGWTDGKGNLWLFAGYSTQYYTSNRFYSSGYFDDFWEYSLNAGSLSAAATPSFSPGTGTYPTGQSVILSDSTPGSTLYYFSSGSASAVQYTTPLALSSTESVQAVAVASGYATSGVATATYTVQQVATPTFSLAPGTYSTQQTLVLSDATPNAVIYYTTDGTTPTTSSTEYTGKITISSSELIQAIAAVGGDAVSTITAAAYTIWPASAGNEWTWMGGSSAGAEEQVTGMLGTPAVGNVPEARYQAVSWTDKRGNFWFFGGDNFYLVGNIGYKEFNDLWEFNPSTHEWGWMAGSISTGQPGGITVGQPGAYGTMGTPSAQNTPGGRQDASGWTDSSGHLWLFGGYGLDANGTMGVLNDLWEFNPSTSEWTWMSGSRTASNCFNDGSGNLLGAIHCAQPSVYGTLGKPAPGNTPGSREAAITWTDNQGNLWLFGGWGFDVSAQAQYNFNELWEYNTSTNQWAWMGGSSTRDGSVCFWDGDLMWYPICGEPGVYGTIGAPAAGNIPGGRAGSAKWTDNKGNLWLFSGYGFDINGNFGDPNDLWEFNSSTRQWTCMEGNNAIPPSGSNPPVYGTLGVPAAGNIPAGRDHAVGWNDSNGNLWLFGGGGSGLVPNSVSHGGMNDLWEFNPSTNQWALMGGSIQAVCGLYCSLSPEAVYGVLGVSAPGDGPGTRFAPAGWTDSGGNFWLFGGAPLPWYGGYVVDNDLWEYQPSTGPLPTTATPTFSVPAGSYASAQSVTISDATNGAFIYYTTDGTTPTISSNAFFRGALPISIQKSETLKTIAVASGCYTSTVATAVYTLPPPAATPTFSLPAGTYTSSQTVTISDATPGATIYYTTNEMPPTTSSNVYSGPIAITNPFTPIEAVAIASGYSISAVSSASYTLVVATPTFSPAAGTYNSAQTVTIADATSGATIYYTTNGATPTGATPSAYSTKYTGAISVSSTETLKAIATATGFSTSAVATATYTITTPAATPTLSVASGTYS
jgi:N-acetylneuraminic acid mutarotase